MRIRRRFMIILTVMIALSAFPAAAQDGGGRRRIAPYTLGQVQTAGSLAPYSAAPDFSNVILGDALSADEKAYLAKNLFVVSPTNEKLFYTVYEKARYARQPLLITVDSMLHSFHLSFKYLLRASERIFIPKLTTMNAALLAKADSYYQALKGTAWEAAATQAVGYFGLATKFTFPDVALPSYVKDAVEADYAAALAAAGIAPSAIFPDMAFGEDWSQYKPRGHYADDPNLSNYFRAVMWYGRLTLRVKDARETQTALLVTLAFRDADIRPIWNAIYDLTTFFVGDSDSPTPDQYLALAEQVYGVGFDLNTLTAQGIDPFVAAAQSLPSPKILNVVIDFRDDERTETLGLRFMGQRFVWDAYAFRQLIFRNVGTVEDGRRLPKALDVFAVLGSERALAILDGEGDRKYKNFDAQMTKLRTEIGGVDDDEWTATLYNTWLYTLDTFNDGIAAGYPSFMLTPAYTDRLLNAGLGSFAELKHNTVLYAAQAYAEMGGGGGIEKAPPPDPILPPNYVEPLPLFWARLAALAEMTQAGMERLGMFEALDEALSDPGRPARLLTDIATKARQMQGYAERELRGELLTDAEQDELRFYGGWLESIYNNTRDDNQGNGAYYAEEEPRSAVITDIATDPRDGVVLQIGTGNIFSMNAVVPIGDQLWAAKGAVYSFYEFTHPIGDRLTDRQWWTMLDEGNVPALPTWTASFISSKPITADAEWAVKMFHENTLISALWWNPVEKYTALPNDPYVEKGVRDYLLKELAPLAEANQYEGRTLISISFRDVDLVNETTMIVTTRETWFGELYAASEKGMDFDGTKIAERGAYTVDMTYTIDYSPQYAYWVVTNVVQNTTPPAWVNVP
ncbi:MAG TPA: DUF3160 domain-containing protein [Aggregatilineales bacterium]|nr:DUF3160 domain-containing protein [Anaerolineales bacterium]HRE48755.1 DUF3160 domain-containing protein [Aggregatilineales bacterium]